jgi:glycosyltransferase involved in cell wall biosynthesis
VNFRPIRRGVRAIQALLVVAFYAIESGSGAKLALASRSERLRIAVVGVPDNPTVPTIAGGTAVFTHLLTEGLVGLGHDVILFAPAGSITDAELVAPLQDAHTTSKPTLGNHVQRLRFDRWALQYVMARYPGVDVIHTQSGLTFLAPETLSTTIPIVATVHATTGGAVRGLAYRARNGYAPRRPIHHVAVSESARVDLGQGVGPNLSVIYNGVDLASYPIASESTRSEDLLFLGRITPKKGPEHALEFARKVGRKLILAGRVCSLPWFDKHFSSAIVSGDVDYVGEITNHSDKVSLLQRAAALIVPSAFNETFCYVVAEAGAVGTPVIASPRGSLPEVVGDGGVITSFHDSSDWRAALAQARRIPTARCRANAERFSLCNTVRDYVDLYRRLARPTRR